ncbi:transcription initiation factor TFIID component TAF4 family-domain-containing protein [Chytridium lagenaria]|nr:transcription initiation factor TFIID component TAF4 family-domain-containing protein [Chytridium lagenaria]
MTRRMSAQLAGPPLSMSSPVPVPGNEPSGQGAPLRLPIAPAPSTMQAKGKAPAETDVDKLDVASMMDVTNYGGVDLREEEESFGMINTANLPPSNPLGVDRSKLQDFLNLTRLKRIVETKGRKHGIRTIDEDTLIYLALAARERATHLLEKMVTASKHRVGILLDQLLDPTTSPAPTTFNISVSNDVRRMIQMTEFMEREEDNRERVRLHPDGSGRSALETARAAALAAQAAGTAHPDAAIMTPLMMMPATTSGFETSGFEGAESLQAAAATGLGGVRGMETVVQADVAAAVAASVAAGDVVKPSKKKKAKKGAVDLTTEAIKARQVNTTALLAAGEEEEGRGGGDGEVKAAKSGGAGVGVGPSGPVDPKVLEEEAQLAKLAKVGVYKDDTGREVRVLRPMTVREMTRVTLRDALFSLESEQQMSSSPLLYKWFGKIN